MPDPQRTHVMWGLGKVGSVLQVQTSKSHLVVLKSCFTLSRAGLCNVGNESGHPVHGEQGPRGGRGQAGVVPRHTGDHPEAGSSVASGQRYDHTHTHTEVIHTLRHLEIEIPTCLYQVFFFSFFPVVFVVSQFDGRSGRCFLPFALGRKRPFFWGWGGFGLFEASKLDAAGQKADCQCFCRVDRQAVSTGEQIQVKSRSQLHDGRAAGSGRPVPGQARGHVRVGRPQEGRPRRPRPQLSSPQSAVALPSVLFWQYLSEPSFEEEMCLWRHFLKHKVLVSCGQAFFCSMPGWFRIVFSDQDRRLRLGR